jgi:DNA-binding PadR family transcriptional regulator
MPASTVSAKELFVLGRLSMRPTHGHEIMRTLAESRSDLWVELSEKHVYYILRKLEREGLVSVSEQREGARPARRVYALTPAGLDRFVSEMRSDALAASIPYSEFDVVFGMLAYTDRLSPAEKTAVLEARAEHLCSLVRDAHDSGLRATGSGSAVLAARVFEKVARVAQAELAWLEKVISDVERDGWTTRNPGAEGESK